MSLLVSREGSALMVVIDRPGAKNALDRSTVEELGRALADAHGDKRVRGVILASTGDVFLSGGDLKEIAEHLDDPDGPRFVLDYFDSFAKAIEVDVPVVAAIHGQTIGGGCEVVLLCDLVVMDRAASMSFRHARLGLTPAWGGAHNLLERAGPLGAAHALYTAEVLDAPTCLRLGLANEIVEDGRCRERAVELVEVIAKSPRAAIAAAKRALTEVRAERRAEAWARERAVFEERWGSPEHRAAMRRYARRR